VTVTPRRTQVQRRTETRAKLVDATIAALHDGGYARTTVKEVCTRAGVSQGGLFRHFPTRQDLMVAAANEVAERHATAFRAAIDPTGVDVLESAVRAARDRCRSPINTVWHELMVACRTDPELQEALAPAASAHRDSIEVLARLVLADAGLPQTAEALVWYVIHCFDGETIGRSLLAHPEGEELRLGWVVDTLRRELAGV
jgi:AcrR family transcriptional regulator